MESRPPCPRCSFANLAVTKFCGGCGLDLRSPAPTPVAASGNDVADTPPVAMPTPFIPAPAVAAHLVDAAPPVEARQTPAPGEPSVSHPETAIAQQSFPLAVEEPATQSVSALAVPSTPTLIPRTRPAPQGRTSDQEENVAVAEMPPSPPPAPSTPAPEPSPEVKKPVMRTPLPPTHDFTGDSSRPPQDERAEPEPKKPVLPIVAAVALALILVGGLAAWWFLKPASESTIDVTSSVPASEVAQPMAETDASEPEEPQEAAAPVEPDPSTSPAQPAAPVAVPAQADEAAAAKAAVEKRLAAERRRQAAEEKRRKAEDAARMKAERDAELAAQRQQAAAARPVAPAPAPASAPVRSSTQEQVAQCQTMNVFQRELCMFKVCNNKWGRDGCPAYEQNKPQEF